MDGLDIIYIYRITFLFVPSPSFDIDALLRHHQCTSFLEAFSMLYPGSDSCQVRPLISSLAPFFLFPLLLLHPSTRSEAAPLKY
jgi:hypothetical protein